MPDNGENSELSVNTFASQFQQLLPHIKYLGSPIHKRDVSRNMIELCVVSNLQEHRMARAATFLQ